MNTKFCYLLAILFSLSLTQGYSQEKPIRVGVLGGANLGSNNVHISPYKREMHAGLRIGGVFEYWTSEEFGIHVNALYSSKGSNYKISSHPYELSWDLAYLSFPVLGKVAFGDRARFYLTFGPEFSFLLSSTLTFSGGPLPTTLGSFPDSEYDVKDNMAAFELPINLGFGVEVSVGTIKMFVDLRGYYSLTNNIENAQLPIYFGNTRIPVIEVVRDASGKTFGGSVSIGVLY